MLTLLLRIQSKVQEILNRTYLTLTNQTSTPSNPPAGQLLLFYKNGLLYRKDENGVEQQILGSNGEFTPLGSIMALYGTVIPSGWLLCDGSTFDQVVYPGLYSFLNNSNIVPDLRGQFLRGKNNGRSDGKQDPDGERAIGHFQLDDFKTHRHAAIASNHDVDSSASQGFPLGNNHISFRTSDRSGVDRTSLISNTGGTETRSKNISVNWIIKAKNLPASQYQINTTNGLSSSIDDINKVINLSLSNPPLSTLFKSGLNIYNNLISPNTKLDIYSGSCRSIQDNYNLVLSSIQTLDITTTSDRGGALINAAWYRIFLISNGTITKAWMNIETDTSMTNIPSGYTYYRRIGAVQYIDSTSGIRRFTQWMNRFLWASNLNEINTTDTTYTDLVVTLVVPTGISISALLGGQVVNNAVNAYPYLFVRSKNTGANAIAIVSANVGGCGVGATPVPITLKDRQVLFSFGGQSNRNGVVTNFGFEDHFID